VAEYLSDEEQVEALKRWWKENGKSVIGGVALGLLIVGGWQGWQRYTAGKAERGSAYFEQFQQAVRLNDAAAAKQEGERLLGEFGEGTYGMLAALELARIAYEEADFANAQGRLRWVMSKADDPALEQLSRLRLVRMLLDQGELDEAADLSARPVSDAFAGEYAAVRGDVALAKGDIDGARRAYRDALRQGAHDQALIRMKLTELGAGPPAG